MNNKLTLITDSTLGKRRDNIFDSIQISNRTRCKEYPQRLLSTQQERKSLLFFSLFFAPFEGPIIHYFRPAGCWFFDVFFFLRTDDSVKLTAFVNCVVVVLFSSLIRDDRYTPPKRERKSLLFEWRHVPTAFSSFLFFKFVYFWLVASHRGQNFPRFSRRDKIKEKEKRTNHPDAGGMEKRTGRLDEIADAILYGKRPRPFSNFVSTKDGHRGVCRTRQWPIAGRIPLWWSCSAQCTL